jgi:hypothetical protein
VTLQEFKASLADDRPPSDVGPLLAALWHDARGDWNRAHDIAQEADNNAGAWVHAYLHRKEGDLPNARYWYGRAGRPASSAPIEDEWESIVSELL